jgi:large subunit ribosomal protein L2
MKLFKVKPITNGIRHLLKIQKNLLSKSNRFFKDDISGKNKVSGRSLSTGHITVRHKGNGVKKVFHFLPSNNFHYYGLVIAILYDPNRSSFISLNYNLLTKKFFKTLHTHNVSPGSLITCTKVSLSFRLGCRYPVQNIPIGSLINNVNSANREKTTYIKSAGSFGQVLQNTKFKSIIKLPSGRIKAVSLNAYGTIGVLSNVLNYKQKYGKAGISRLKGIRPTVRGIAMNPVDHPHGGRTNGGCIPVTPWGIPTRGKPTVKNKI